MAKVPAKKSEGEETLLFHIRQYLLPEPEREYKFLANRKYRFDLAWPDAMIAVEVNGGTAFGKSRHSRGEGIEEDYRKFNRAARMGWAVYHFTTAQVKSAEAIDFLREVFK
jgi:hypothetical protein